MLNAHFLRCGHDIAASPLHVLPRDLEVTLDVVRRLQKVIGFGVTLPRKNRHPAYARSGGEAHMDMRFSGKLWIYAERQLAETEGFEPSIRLITA